MASMTTRAAVLHEAGTDWEITELDLDEPKDYEVLIRYKAAGLCHSDEHIRAEGGSHIRLPLVGGHEGAGVVEAVGPGVTRVTPGDHRGHLLHPGVRQVPLLLHRASEPV
jgi:S-(hydroxymethyl)glutathione dehydrogenase/alcohol dehydrogenase